tara:strand:- start:414 stop:797 length:384 start_codon:yes stop_codon:yes gene_type:complete
MAFKQKGFPIHAGTSPAKQLKPHYWSEDDIHRVTMNVTGQPEKGSVKETEWIEKGKLTKDGKKKHTVENAPGKKLDERSDLMNEMKNLEASEKKNITNEGQIRLQDIADRLTEMDKAKEKVTKTSKK